MEEEDWTSQFTCELDAWEVDFLLGDPASGAAFAAACSVLKPLSLLCLDAIARQPLPALTSLERQYRKAHDDDDEGGGDEDAGHLLPEHLAAKLVQELIEQDSLTDDVLSLILKRLTRTLDLTAQRSSARLGKVLSTSSARMLRILRLNKMAIYDPLELDGLPLLEDVILDGTTPISVKLHDCPRLRRIYFSQSGMIVHRRLQDFSLSACPALESFTFDAHGPADAAVALALRECPKLRYLEYRNPQFTVTSKEPFELVLDHRECMLEELRINSNKLRKLSLAGGAPHLRRLELLSCFLLLSVEVANAPQLQHLSLDRLLVEHPQTSPPPKVAIERANSLVHLSLSDVHHRWRHLLEPVPETLAYLRLAQASSIRSEVSAYGLSTLLSDRPLRYLTELSLELPVIDSFLLDSDAALPVLAKLLVKGHIHHVRLALAGLRAVRLWNTRGREAEGSLTVACPLLDELELRLFDNHAIRLTCPALASLKCVGTKVPPSELTRWPEALPRLQRATVIGVDDDVQEITQLGLSHVPDLKSRQW